MQKIGQPSRPSGITRWFYRLPIVLYRLGMARLMGERFMYLAHTGRRTGLRRETVIEVVEHDDAKDIYFVASGWGVRSDWYRNVLATPHVEAQVGGRQFQGEVAQVEKTAAGEVFSRYGERHPRALKALAQVMGYRIEATDDDYRALGREIPVLAIRVEADDV